MKKIITVIYLFFICLFTEAVAQIGAIQGNVTDDQTGETLPGVKVSLDGTTKIVLTDFDGKFTIQGIEPGIVSLTFKYSTYNSKNITDIIVKSKETTNIAITLGSIVKEQEEVVVKATIKKESNTALLLQQKNSASVSDGISSESIKRTPDRSTSDVLKRISGASIQDNKFAIIRGLNDRYNAAYINGAPLPSSESDRKAFSFDIFPANMLDNLVIIKTATPDLPAEFAGGVIQINTKSIPEDNFKSISISSGYNTITTGKELIGYQGGKYDFIGIDDGKRAMNKNIPGLSNDFPTDINKQGELAKITTTNWGLRKDIFAPNLNFQYSQGLNWFIGKRRIGLLAALNYNKSNVYSETERHTYDNGSGDILSLETSNILDKNYSSQVFSGALINAAFKINEKNQISFKNVLSVNTDDKTIMRSGVLSPSQDPTNLKANVKWFTSNQIYTSQLIGEHFFEKSKIKLNWNGSFSAIKRAIPNLRRSIYTQNQGEGEKFTAAIESSTGPSYGGTMFFSENNEGIRSLKTDIIIPLNIGENFKNEIKLGGFTQHRYRDFSARLLGYAKYTTGLLDFDTDLLTIDEDHIFDEKNMGKLANGKGGFRLIEGTKPSDSYTASSDLQAGFIQFDNKWKKNIRLIWGIRAENFKQNLYAVKKTGDTLNLNNEAVLDALPSANLVYSLGNKQNVRLSYSQTLNRPEYRELAPFAFYDFTTQFVISGNESLKRAKIENLDLRYECFLGKGQLISASFFKKTFSNPIEQISRPDVADAIYYDNVASAENTGLEIEARLLLSTLFNLDSNRILNQFTVFSNLAIIRSSIDLSQVVGAKSRPLQGQSPYVFNAGISYTNSEKELSLTLNANQVGPRIFIVGNINEPDIWENSRLFIDFQIAKSFTKQKNSFELKLNLQNILAQKQIFYQKSEKSESIGSPFLNNVLYGDKNQKTTFDEKNDDLLWSTVFGRIASISVSYKF